ncbi:MAG: RluA family pseudouridine synthase [Alphaproteobacteria bacterium]|nr:RluA family pseudouridine synthase [Alphaproteobacteria bacterium]
MSESPRVLFTDGDLYAVAKPAGWPVHPNDGHDDDLLGWLRRSVPGSEALAPVHRLDLATSGLVLFAKSAERRAQLAATFARGEVLKTYLAVVHGRARSKGVVQRALKDGRRGRPLRAITRYRRVSLLGSFTLVELNPSTGRKHQLRRHMQGIGHPIVGDPRYGPATFRPVPAFPGRLWLHAATLELPEGLRIACPLPPLLAEHLDILAAGARSREAATGS